MIALDKQIHLLAGVAIAGLSSPFGMPVMAACVCAAAIGKEVYDSYHRDKHTPDALDALATMAGGVVYVGWIHLVGIL